VIPDPSPFFLWNGCSAFLCFSGTLCLSTPMSSAQARDV
jgi:hypothetical protein